MASDERVYIGCPCGDDDCHYRAAGHRWCKDCERHVHLEEQTEDGECPRHLATNREPRPIITDPVELGKFLESPEPPLGLAQGEVNLMVGRPPQDLQTGEGAVPGFKGTHGYSRHEFIHYRRDDGRVLTYRYEGDLAYALVLAPADQQEGEHRGK